ncbi:hypothetical protein ACTD5D_18745 [Nocardia takedensis]|nr:hypothetical protein [Nocardia takedensis]
MSAAARAYPLFIRQAKGNRERDPREFGVLSEGGRYRCEAATE